MPNRNIYSENIWNFIDIFLTIIKLISQTVFQKEH